jgi:hypothetical protein
MINQVLSVIGAVMILGAYLAFQRGWLARRHRSFHALNLVGSGLLTIVAVADGRIGFILLEGIWAVISIPGTIKPPQATAPSVT